MTILKVKDWLLNAKQFKIVKYPGGKAMVRLKDGKQFNTHDGVILQNGETASIVEFHSNFIHIAVRMRKDYRDRRYYPINEIEPYVKQTVEHTGIYSF